MSYLPHSDQDQAAMLAALQLESVEELFDQIPAAIRTAEAPDIPGPLSEMELVRHMQGLAGENRSLEDLVCFAGGGVYDRFVPSIVHDVTRRPEFLTPYTPYQAEASQGTLAAMFEYQTMICELTGMEVANASLYDGASSLAEAVLMAARVKRRSRVLVSRAVPPGGRLKFGDTRRYLTVLSDKHSVYFEKVTMDRFQCLCGWVKVPLLNGTIKTAKELAESGESFWV